MSNAQMRIAFKREFARLLRETREKRGFSLGVLARRAGVARQTVANVERGGQNSNLATLLQISSGLGVRLSKLFGEARKRAEGKVKMTGIARRDLGF
jgi:transcriptional regulator with XRE-family HTH domain